MNRRGLIAASAAALASVVAIPGGRARAAEWVPTTPVHPDLVLPWGGPDNPAIFVHAHQDDDTLTFGPEAEVHGKAGRHVLFNCVTDGRNSGVRNQIGLSIKDFSQARSLEYLNALQRLVANEVHFSGLMDGFTTADQTLLVAKLLVARYPRASFKVQTWRDNHHDHANIGNAFRTLKNANPNLDIKFYVKPEQRAEIGALERLYRVPGAERTLAAINEYRVYNPGAGRWAIGEKSVSSSFRLLEQDNASYWHY